MTLNAVGSTQGTDNARIAQIKKLNSAKKSPSKIYAAGGIRDINDVRKLSSMGISGVLLASALHNGYITADIIKKFYNQ
jgi:phosphoribosylformimino-5-aminoimidazole carboxamide ribotide isomerase